MGKKAHLPYTFEFLGVNEAKFISFTPLPHHPNMAHEYVSGSSVSEASWAGLLVRFIARCGLKRQTL